MFLLKKGVPFYWDESTQSSFDALKKYLVSTPLLSPPDYNQDFLLYLVAVESLIGMVLVQEDDELQEQVIYYLSYALMGHKIKYSHLKSWHWKCFMLSNDFDTILCYVRQPLSPLLILSNMF
jgi:hypothetical protein